MLYLLMALFLFTPSGSYAAPAVLSIQYKGISEKNALIGELSAQLKSSPDTNTAEVLASAIRKLWRNSGSTTIDLLMSRAQRLDKIKQYDQAVNILGAVSVIAPDYAQGWYLRADILLKTGEFGRALHDIGKALELEPRHFDALVRLGIILKELGDNEGALNAFEKAIALHPYLSGLSQIVDQLSEKLRGKAI